jgi:hypothetical protein
MRQLSLFIILFSLVSAEALASEIIEVPLPELRGIYSNEISGRIAEFQLERAPDTVFNVSIYLSGTVSVGEYWCLTGFGTEGPFPYPIEFVGSIRDTVNAGPWLADELTPEVTGQFELAIPFRELYGRPVTWEFLESGRSSVELHGWGPMLLAICSASMDPDATVEEAKLIIEADFPVSSRLSTWGRIKALFR